jgi:hypothetical protein
MSFAGGFQGLRQKQHNVSTPYHTGLPACSNHQPAFRRRQVLRFSEAIVDREGKRRRPVAARISNRNAQTFCMFDNATGAWRIAAGANTDIPLDLSYRSLLPFRVNRDWTYLVSLCRDVDLDLRSMGAANWDISIFQGTNIGEKLNAKFRVEIFNTFNRVMLGIPKKTCYGVNPNNATATNSSFGVNSTLLKAPRQVKLALKIIYQPLTRARSFSALRSPLSSSNGGSRKILPSSLINPSMSKKYSRRLIGCAIRTCECNPGHFCSD